MTDSVAERIMQHIQTTIESITVENGYANTIHTVQRLQQDGQEPVSGNGVHVIEGDDTVLSTLLGGEFDVLDRQRHVDLVIIGQQDADEDSRSAAEVMNSLEVDVRKAMQVDYMRGGDAINTIEAQASELDVQTGMPELRRVLGYDIRYRHRRTDPTLAG